VLEGASFPMENRCGERNVFAASIFHGASKSPRRAGLPLGDTAFMICWMEWKVETPV